MKINHIFNGKNIVDLTTIDWSLIVGRDKVEKIFADYQKRKGEKHGQVSPLQERV